MELWGFNWVARALWKKWLCSYSVLTGIVSGPSSLHHLLIYSGIPGTILGDIAGPLTSKQMCGLVTWRLKDGTWGPTGSRAWACGWGEACGSTWAAFSCHAREFGWCSGQREKCHVGPSLAESQGNKPVPPHSLYEEMTSLGTPPSLSLCPSWSGMLWPWTGLISSCTGTRPRYNSELFEIQNWQTGILVLLY